MAKLGEIKKRLEAQKEKEREARKRAKRMPKETGWVSSFTPKFLQEARDAVGSPDQYPTKGPGAWKHYYALMVQRERGERSGLPRREGVTVKIEIPRASNYVKEERLKKVLLDLRDPPLKSILARIIIAYYDSDFYLDEVIEDMQNVSSQANIRRIIKNLSSDGYLEETTYRHYTWSK